MNTAGAAMVPALFSSNIMMGSTGPNYAILPHGMTQDETREKPDNTRVYRYLN